MREITHFIDGASVASRGESAPVYNPGTGQEQARLLLGDASTLEAAVQSARAAQPGWAKTNPQRRARVLFAFKSLLERHFDDLARLISSEHGKLVSDARGELQRGLEVIEFACAAPTLTMGDFTAGAGPGVDVYSMREPLGVVGGITPFNFPAMVPLWMIGPALAAGNAFILKPSERDPSAANFLAELFIEAGLPKGVLNVVHGGKAVVDAMLKHPAIQAISFVGSTDIARYVYATGAAHGKRVQAMGGAKNHGVVMADADFDQTVADILGAAYGSAGERCMALPVVVAVGDEVAEALRARLVDEIKRLRVGVFDDEKAHLGPVITAQHKAKIESYIALGVEEGAELVLDGRDFTLKGHETGFFLGPSLFDHVKPEMRSYREEIFGPVLQMVRAPDLAAAIELVAAHQYGNGATIFTRSGAAAQRFVAEAKAGMVGVNVPIPVPVAYHSFGGWKDSAFGDHNQYGMEGVRFYTRVKTATQRWPSGGKVLDQGFVMPTMR